MGQIKGVIAAGHELTVRAAEEVLLDGGNAFDAVVAAHFAACITEPVLSSPAGGGFLMAGKPDGSRILYDFFAQTPCRHRPVEEVDFFPISAEFGETSQEYHIGMGSFATPGTVAGLFAIHRELCTLPMPRLAEPAARMAREGVKLNAFQAWILQVVRAVYLAFPETCKRFMRPDIESGMAGRTTPDTESGMAERSTSDAGSDPESNSGSDPASDPGSVHGSDSDSNPGTQLLGNGDLLQMPDLADTLESIAREGEDLFYRGEIADRMARMSRESGGHITRVDLAAYEVIRRKPLQMKWRDTDLSINPAPSTGGPLIAFAMQLLDSIQKPKVPFGSTHSLMAMARVQQMTDAARLESTRANPDGDPAGKILEPGFVKAWRQVYKKTIAASRGTTHISIMDRDGNTASLTTSNGEGCGLLIPDTGIMMNNMLGEADLHPDGFHQWPLNRRIASMMAPAILNRSDRTEFTLGSGGSNRLRTAILQVIVNLVEHRMSLEEAVSSPRIHCEGEEFSMEAGFDPDQTAPLKQVWQGLKIWSGQSLYFGGTHSVSRGPDGFAGAGDPRRGGASRIVVS